MVDATRPKRVVLGVSASIAAYKAADLASQLVKAGIDVYPVLTPDAARFVQPATFRALTGNACSVDIFEEPVPGQIGHIWLAQNCDLIAIVPASMTVMAKLANGIADDMLTGIVMAASAPVLFAPGMNSMMWKHPATQKNLQTLSGYGYYFLEPVSGRLACRTVGVGKMAEVSVIYDAIVEALAQSDSWTGRSVLITAGPTREPIDPVRYLSNRSSGKMGYALAEAARLRGANVTLVSGPTSLRAPGGVKVISIETAEESYLATMAEAPGADLIIAAAAVADYKPAHFAEQKIKKNGEVPSLDLVETRDVIAAVAGARRPGQIIVGFSAESERLLEHAAAKRAAKGLDWIVANDITQEGAGFDVDTNIVTLIGPERHISLPLMSKRDVADRILDEVWPD
jgi:phosphopantothenoylcysteine decarboxylase/phosphopantothenate--cysteine ligase